METDDAGLDVVEVAWSYHVPAYVCSGGYQHRNQPIVRIAPEIENFKPADGMTKKFPETWYQIIKGIISDATGEGGLLLQAVLRVRKAGGVPVPNEFSGEQARMIAQGYLDAPEEK